MNENYVKAAIIVGLGLIVAMLIISLVMFYA
jgi:hypothetical protein